MYPVCAMQSSAVTVSARCPCWPPLIFDVMDAAFPLTGKCSSIRSSLVNSPPILGSIRVRKSMKTPLTLIVVPIMLHCTLGGHGGGFFPWKNLYNMLNW